MDDGWWGPTTVVPGEAHARILVIEKSLPGSILVNKRGARFVNEASAYIDVVNAMYAGRKAAISIERYLGGPAPARVVQRGRAGRVGEPLRLR